MTDTDTDFGTTFDHGIAYEGLRESIVLEMSQQNTLVDKYGENSELGLKHRKTLTRLAKVLRHLTPSNTAAIEIAGLMLDTLRAQRAEHTAA